MPDDDELDDPFKTENRQWPDGSGKATHDRERREFDEGAYRRSREDRDDWVIPRPEPPDDD